MNEYETYIDTIEEIENRVVDDTKYPVITRQQGEEML